jgi:hypothetical protein
MYLIAMRSQLLNRIIFGDSVTMPPHLPDMKRVTVLQNVRREHVTACCNILDICVRLFARIGSCRVGSQIATGLSGSRLWISL